MSERQLQHVKVTGEFLTNIFTNGEVHARVDGLPDDAEFRRIEYDPAHDCYWLIVWSAKFDEIPEASPIPEAPVTFTELVSNDDPEDGDA